MHRAQRRQVISIFFAGALALVVTPSARAQSVSGEGESADADRALLDLLEADLEASMRAWPTWASVRGDRRFDDRLPDVRPEAFAARLEESRARLAALDALLEAKGQALSPARRLDAALLRRELEERIAGARFAGWQMPVGPMGGPQQDLIQLPGRLSFTSQEQRRAWVERLAAIPRYLDQQIANLRAGLAAGRTPPRAVLGRVAEQALAQATPELRAEPRQHPLFAPLRALAQDDPLAVRGRKVLGEQVIPAYQRLGEFLAEEYVPKARESLAASALPEGAAYYAHAVRAHTTTDLSPQEVHALGQRELARIREEMEEVIARTDFPRKEELEGAALVAAFVEWLREQERFYFDDAQALLDGYRAIAKTVDAELPRLFGRLPRMPYGVKAMDPLIAPSSPTAYYYRGSLKNGTPGWFVANTHRLDQRPKYEMVALTLHEAVPGHHLQLALAAEMEDVPEWRQTVNFTAFVEGWGLYAERLGLEMRPPGSDSPRGLYADPYDDFGRLSYEMWRALRLVVDTGIHALGWSRQQAIDLMLTNSALTQENVEREVDRYISWPGQALAYKHGELKLRARRAQAEAALGERFGVRAFHDVVLAQGALPLDLLEEVVEGWIEERRR